jgi:hypothetical protein
MAALLIARFDGDINELTQAYDRGHALIMSRGGATSFGRAAAPLRSREWRSFHRRRLGLCGAHPKPLVE